MSKKASKKKIDFDEAFGELRSLTEQRAWDAAQALELWKHLFASNHADRARFEEQIVPYVRQTGFFGSKEGIAQAAELEQLYEGESRSVTLLDEEWAYDGDDFDATLCYGWPVDAVDFALLGDPSDWIGDKLSKLCVMLPFAQYSPELTGRVIVGVDIESIFARNVTFADKVAACEKALETTFAKVRDALGEVGEPSFYLFGQGFKVDATLMAGAIETEWTARDDWDDADGVVAIRERGFDLAASHDRYCPDDEDEATLYRGVTIHEFCGATRIRPFSISSDQLENLARQFKRAAGWPDVWALLTHM